MMQVQEVRLVATVKFRGQETTALSAKEDAVGKVTVSFDAGLLTVTDRGEVALITPLANVRYMVPVRAPVAAEPIPEAAVLPAPVDKASKKRA